MPREQTPIRKRSVERWRSSCLRAAGFPAELARELGDDCRYDVHALIELAERGCPPELAARILTPLDEAWRPC
jgi:hypothetical protein